MCCNKKCESKVTVKEKQIFNMWRDSPPPWFLNYTENQQLTYQFDKIRKFDSIISCPDYCLGKQVVS